MNDFEKALKVFGETIQKIVKKIKEILQAVVDLMVPYHRSIIVKYTDKGPISDLIRRYSFLGRRLRVRERICNSSFGNNGNWKLYFYMTNNQFKHLMTKIAVRKFDWKLLDYQAKIVEMAYSGSKLNRNRSKKYDKNRRNRK